jgi:hypothetical protein
MLAVLLAKRARQLEHLADAWISDPVDVCRSTSPIDDALLLARGRSNTYRRLAAPCPLAELNSQHYAFQMSSTCCANASGRPALSTRTTANIRPCGRRHARSPGVLRRCVDQTGLRPNATPNAFTVRCSFSSLDIALIRSLHSSADTPSFA